MLPIRCASLLIKIKATSNDTAQIYIYNSRKFQFLVKQRKIHVIEKNINVEIRNTLLGIFIIIILVSKVTLLEDR